MRRLSVIAAALCLAAAPSGPSINDRMQGDLTPVHDPSIIAVPGGFVIASTAQEGEKPGLIPLRRSPDLVNWTSQGAVFSAIPAWAKEKISGTKGIWAPDLSRTNGQYRIYYSVSTFGSNTSAIGLVTSPSLDPKDPTYKWTDQGLVIASSKLNDYNAIDPNLVTEADGHQWLAFGSFWTGLKLIAIDPATGKPAEAKPVVHAIAQRPAPDALEAPSIIHRGEFYYLFAAFDFCCRGKDSTYYTAVGRSKAIMGPYLDSKGRRMMDGYAEVVLHARFDKSRRFVGPGGATVITSGNRALIAYHGYDTTKNGLPTLRIQPLGFDKDGWPVAL
ncbi:MAG: arabinan endo-1,5-alpha-L-arabinosidase [Sphingomicrobium sp.]